MDLSPVTLSVLVGSMFGAAFVNGTIGFGFALLAVNVLALVLGAKDGIIVLSLLTPVVSGIQVWHFRAHRMVVGRLRPLILAALVGTAIGSQILVFLPGYLISLALGLLTAFDVFVELRGRGQPLALRTERRLAPVAGFIGGISSGTLGASGPVFGSYLVAIGMRGAEFALAITTIFFATSLMRNVVLAGLGQYTTSTLGLAVVLLVPALVGQRVGFWLRGRLPALTLERAVLILLLVAGLNLLFRGIEGLLAAAGG
jgi:uncharacterized membrane protein YfcA